jgi:hypothetical protein
MAGLVKATLARGQDERQILGQKMEQNVKILKALSFFFSFRWINNAKNINTNFLLCFLLKQFIKLFCTFFCKKRILNISIN